MYTLRAAILAAGQGTRLLPLTATMPKCLLRVGSRSIIEHELNGLLELGVSEVLILTGFQADALEEQLGAQFGKMTLRYARAANFRTANNAATLQLAADFLGRGGILLEGDVVWGRNCQQRLSSCLHAASSGITWMASPFQAGQDGSVLVTAAGGQVRSMEIVRPGSTLPPGQLWKSGGLLLLDEPAAQCLFRHLDAEDPVTTAKYFDVVIAEHIADFSIRVLPIDAGDWAEIDTADDLRRAAEVMP